MSDNMERKFKEYRRQLRATANKKCRFCGFDLVPTADNNGLICPRWFNFDQFIETSQNYDDDDDNLPPLLNIEPDFRRNRRSG